MVEGEAEGIGAALVGEYHVLLRYAKRLTRNEAAAADLVQTVMMYALTKGQHVRDPQRIGSWLRTVLFRLFVDERRRASRETSLDVAALEQLAPPAEPPPSWDALSIDDVRESMAQLPAHFREPYELFTFQRLSYQKIASLSELPLRTIGTRISRARQRLRALLQAHPTDAL